MLSRNTASAVHARARPNRASLPVWRTAIRWIFVMLAGLFAGNVTAAGFVAGGTPGTPRTFSTTTVLPSGKVLVAGGVDAGSTVLDSAELYDRDPDRRNRAD